ncbi:hypothetical protein RJ640_004661 [Escallonia rubra]|uniref:DNA-directed DNA polymerase family A palm domain-containing protein n=1 Tax=Escallonia rubra TaxID=112253 RepID=A0AA88RSP5_9ASTE|nr:hypothetical protein RJ640_004661 [Escallonia rubra]
MGYGGNQRVGDVEDYQRWKLDPSGRMLLCRASQNTCSPSVEKKQQNVLVHPHNCSNSNTAPLNNYRQSKGNPWLFDGGRRGTRRDWHEEKNKLRTKTEASSITKCMTTDFRIADQLELDPLQESIMYGNSMNIGAEGALYNSFGEEETDTNQTNLITSVLQCQSSCQEQTFENGTFQRTRKADVPANGVSLSRVCSEDRKEIKAVHEFSRDTSVTSNDARETYIVPISDGKFQGVGQKTRLRERLIGIYDKVLVVDNVSLAKDVVRLLTYRYRHLIYACDTEAYCEENPAKQNITAAYGSQKRGSYTNCYVAKIDVKQETPVNHGEIICFSIYAGTEADFGNGKSCIWVDVLDGGGSSLLAVFAPFFEDPTIKKVWHNYSFDNHVIENYGLKLSGFHADTMHMARLWDSSRRTQGGYSLEALTGDPRVMNHTKLAPDEELIGKVSMKTIFGKKKMKKDGSEGKMIIIPPVEELQQVDRKPWIGYSALDSISTLKLYESLKGKLSCMEWILDGVKKGSMYDFYEKYWCPFGELLVKMETEGMLVDRSYLADIEKVAQVEQQIAADRFRNWASEYCPDAKYMNVGSDAQLRQLFFGGATNRKNADDSLSMEREFKIPNIDKVVEEGKKVPTKFRTITLHCIADHMQTEHYTASGWPSVSGDALKALSGKVSAKYDFTDEESELQLDENVQNMPEIENDQHSKAKQVAVNEGPDLSAYGTAFASFGKGSKGIQACHAIAALCEVCSIDSLISNFILPLQGSHISGKNGRIHCSLNINTETGRLSARRPNLQNQPALEKDRYKIRQAFIAAPGNSLIVADYGQLELRILAHLANCKSMLDAFKAGGDFHSRTAMNMYPYIREAVEQKHVLLEWDPQPGEEKPPVPLLKDAFGSERRKAKMLNFSIAYGKTVAGLARDWKVSVKEARETVERWYRERTEVLNWQEARKAEARTKGRVHTLLGRARIAKNSRLKKLGWRLLLQVHDEVILEGPTESAEVAKAIVVDCMSKPFDGKNTLGVDLSVDAKCAQSCL